MTTGEHMREARERKGVSRAKLSRISGVHYQAIYNAEKDKCYTNLFSVICLADALKIPIDEYIGRTVKQ